MRGWVLLILVALLLTAPLTNAQTSDPAEPVTWQWTAVDPGYSVGWFDCLWRSDTLYLATRESFGYYLKLFSYVDGKLAVAGLPARYEDSVLWKQGYYGYDLLDRKLDLLSANDTAVLRYRLGGKDEDRIETARYKAGKFGKERIEAVAAFPRDDGVFMVFRSGVRKTVLDIDNNPRFYGKYFLIEVDSLAATDPKTFGGGRRNCDFFLGLSAGDTLYAVYREREAGPWFDPDRKHTERTLFLKYVDGRWSEPTVATTEEHFPGIFSWPVGFYRAGGEFYLITVSVSASKDLSQSLYCQSSRDGLAWSSPQLAVKALQNFAAGGVAPSGHIHLLIHDPSDSRRLRHVVFDGSVWTDRGVRFSNDESRFRFREGPDSGLYLFYTVGNLDQRTLRFLRIE